MKRPLISLAIPLILVLHSSVAIAHPGHLPGEFVHSFLHAEHIALILVVGVIAFIAAGTRNK